MGLVQCRPGSRPGRQSCLLFDSISKKPEPSLRGALATKQSILSSMRRDGLLRYARNDGGYAFAFSRRVAPEACWKLSAPSIKRAQGMPDARCTRGLMRNVHRKCAHEHTGQRRQSDIPCAMALRLIASSCVLKICQNVRTGGSRKNRPSLDLSPSVLEGLESLSGSVGQVRCLPQPEQLHGLRARTEQGRELDDGTK